VLNLPCLTPRAMMVAATAFMLARSGDMLDNYDE
jgi:hypothetical protein